MAGMFDDLVPASQAAAPAASAPQAAPAGLFADLIPQPKGRSLGGELIRQGGLTARYALEGLPATADMLLTPVRAGVNAVSSLFGGPQARTLSEEGTNLADKLGLPAPETPAERVVGDASRMVAGAAGGGSAGGAIAKATKASSPVVSGVAGKFAQAPGMQAVSGAAAGAAGGITREQGGSPLEQFAASLAGGLLAPSAAGAAAAGAGKLQRTAAQMADPGRLDAVLKVELQRAGINWDDLGAMTKLALRKDAEKAVYSGQPLNAQALGRLADYRNVGATPLVGDITQDPRLLTLQRNLTKQLANQHNPVLGSADLPQIDNRNAGRVLSTLEGSATSPLDAYATGERIIDRVVGKDTAMRGAESALHTQAREAMGRDIPLDRSTFVNEAFGNLAKSNRASFLPESVGKMLDQIAAGAVKVGDQSHPVPFNVDTIDQLKTVLASATRATADGNTKAAIKAVRDALENAQPVKTATPEFGGGQIVNGATAQAMRQGDAAPAEAMRLFDQARAASRSRFQWQESAGFIEDALGGAAPDKFVQKHVINASVRDLTRLRDEIGGAKAAAPSGERTLSTVVADGAAPAKAEPQNIELLNAVRKQLVDYVLQRGRADSNTTKFSSAGMADGLKALGDRKLALFFSPDEIQQIKSAVNVGRYMQSQPIGSAVNNSNSGAMLMGRLGDMLAAGSGIPGVQLVADPLRGAVASMQARSLKDLSAGLAPAPARSGAGASLIPLSALLAAPGVKRPQDDHGP